MDSISSAVSQFNATARNISGITEAMKQLLKPIQQQLNYHLPPPPQENSQQNPATSCKGLLKKQLNADSGYYWISKSSGSPVRMYCDMSKTACGDQRGGWMRVANLDMTNTSHTCPSGLNTITSPKRLCDYTGNNACCSTTFSVEGVQYSRACGKIIGYQNRVPIAFSYNINSINSAYMFGVSLTRGSPRKHIWTFVGASDETTSNSNFKCSCMHNGRSSVPSFMGNDYFCDTALQVHYGSASRGLHTTDPLWDGSGCGSTSTCCQFNTPPWFTKNLTSTSTDNIEMRLCRPSTDGSTPIEIVELYAQ